ncbi:MAG: metallophosphoesterase [Alistipes sp.]|nr:metallophosphoesterase [Alistipes sp.]
MIWIVLLLIAAATAVDFAAYRRLVKPTVKSAAHRHALLAAMLLADMLPLITTAFFAALRDNDTPAMKAAMWIMFAWLLLVPPRMILFAALLSSRRPAVRTAGAVAAAALAALLVYGACGWRDMLTVTRVEIRSERLPEAFDGFRIVQFSDLHIGSLVHPRAEMRRLVDTINSLNADLVVFTGDLVNIRYTELDDETMRLLGGIEAPVLSVTGNHDTGIYVRDSVSLPREENIRLLLERQRRMGWTVLDNETAYIRRGGDSIAVTGLSFDLSLRNVRHSGKTPDADIRPAYEGVPQGMFDITLAHIPQMWELVTGLGAGDLTLSGHVHSMQSKVRLFGRQYSPARLMYRRWSGLYEKNGRYLYINDGIGYVGVPMRLGAKPEITLFTLER